MSATHTRLGGRRHPHGHRQAGGLLIEVSLVMLIVGILTVATFEVHSAMRKRQQTADARSLLHSIDAALRAFVIRERRLPCPATGGGAVEVGGGSGDCAARVGEIPFLTLGMEIPALGQDRVMRYGVAEGLSDTSGNELLVKAEAASRTIPNTSAPYVAGRDTHQLFGACNQAALNPAYALMWMPSPGVAGAQPVPGLCFRESADQSMGLLAVSGQEFFGWLLANLRQ